MQTEEHHGAADDRPLGYRPQEYAFARRGRLQDELPRTLPTARADEEFVGQGRRVRLIPHPRTKPHSPCPAHLAALPLFPHEARAHASPPASGIRSAVRR
ncbi:hypothetical protein [Streptomyces misionensis]|uniref:hypothetical protein n=1 Tax=Streptomyces misionensis TaxID=67331 RepID=UPI0036A9DAF3